MNQDQQLREAADIAANNLGEIASAMPTQELADMVTAEASRLFAALTATQQAAPSQGAGERAELIRKLNNFADWLDNARAPTTSFGPLDARLAAALLSASAQREQPAADDKAGGDEVATVYTMEALVPGGEVKYHATVHKPVPAGTKLYTRPQPQADQPAERVAQFQPARDCGCKTAEDCDGFCRHGAPVNGITAKDQS